jgi:glycosyltransferase involved in cell wall biosynthesis
MIAFLRDNDIRAVFVNVLSSRFETNLVRYLPSDILRIMIVHNITPGTYAAAREIRDHVHATIGVSRRCRDDLVSHYGFNPARVLVIPHGLEKDELRMRPDPAVSLRLLYLGRIEDTSKGVFWLPAILRGLTCDYRLTVAGDGPDLLSLRHRLQRIEAKADFTGFVAPSDVPAVASQHDVLIMPSRFEGFGLTLIEAMSQGCVPVASRIAGVTDMIVTHAEDGLLFPVGDCRRAAAYIMKLAADTAMRTQMAAAARQKVAVAFDSDRVGAAYAALLNDLTVDPPGIAASLQLNQWRMPVTLHSSLRSRLPAPVKNWLRQVKERLNTAWSAT